MTPTQWAGRRGPLSTDETKMCQCTLGELCWVAAVSLPDGGICITYEFPLRKW